MGITRVKVKNNTNPNNNRLITFDRIRVLEKQRILVCDAGDHLHGERLLRRGTKVTSSFRVLVKFLRRSVSIMSPQ